MAATEEQRIQDWNFLETFHQPDRKYKLEEILCWANARYYWQMQKQVPWALRKQLVTIIDKYARKEAYEAAQPPLIVGKPVTEAAPLPYDEQTIDALIHGKEFSLED